MHLSFSATKDSILKVKHALFQITSLFPFRVRLLIEKAGDPRTLCFLQSVHQLTDLDRHSASVFRK